MALEFVAYKNPISASLRELILQEKFECVRLGVTKEWLSKNFPEPDGYLGNETAETSNIWQYGNVEFHFHKDVLYMIFTDYVETIDAGPKLQLDPWILKYGAPTYFSDWVSVLNREGLDFKVVQKAYIEQTHIILSDENEGSTLSFVWSDSEHEPKNGNPKLGAIHLISRSQLAD